MYFSLHNIFCPTKSILRVKSYKCIPFSTFVYFSLRNLTNEFGRLREGLTYDYGKPLLPFNEGHPIDCRFNNHWWWDLRLMWMNNVMCRFLWGWTDGWPLTMENPCCSLRAPHNLQVGTIVLAWIRRWWGEKSWLFSSFLK